MVTKPAHIVPVRRATWTTRANLGGFPDGIAFDCEGNLWGTLIGHEKLFVLTPNGDQFIVLDVGKSREIETFEMSVEESRCTLEEFTNCAWDKGGLITSVAFGGPDLKTVYTGNLAGQSIPSFRSPVAGLPLLHNT